MAEETPEVEAGALVPLPDDEPSEDEVARRAYEISQSEEASGPEADWLRAERELREAREGQDEGQA